MYNQIQEIKKILNHTRFDYTFMIIEDKICLINRPKKFDLSSLFKSPKKRINTYLDSDLCKRNRKNFTR